MGRRQQRDRSSSDEVPRTDVWHAALRGTVAAMSMSGLRMLSTSLGLLEETPPEMIADEKVPGVLRRFAPSSRKGVLVILHWVYGAAGGAFFGLLPVRLRLKPGAGPVYGVVLWVGFEAALVPLLGLHHRRNRPVTEYVALAADHLLYGAVLAELRRRPRR